MRQSILYCIIISLLFTSCFLGVGGRSLPDYIDISVDEAWDLLSDTSNGIQIPIDVRTDAEWEYERIDTSFPEDPRHYTLSKLQTEEGLKEFISKYDGSEIILYCKSGGRSSSAAYILSQSNFSGIIYNMVGGITTWKSSGYRTKIGNKPPYIPDIPSGPIICNINRVYNFSINISDPDDDAVRAGWDWNNDDYIDEWTPFYASGSITVVTHKWSIPGEYSIKVLVEDRVGAQSGFSDTLIVTVNSPPIDLEIDGVYSGKSGENYVYNLTSIDPEDDDIYYFVDWGDGSNTGWLGPYKSGENIDITHSWSERGNYIVKAKAKDIYDAESDWVTLKVSILISLFNKINLLYIFKEIFNGGLLCYLR